MVFAFAQKGNLVVEKSKVSLPGNVIPCEGVAADVPYRQQLFVVVIHIFLYLGHGHSGKGLDIGGVVCPRPCDSYDLFDIVNSFCKEFADSCKCVHVQCPDGLPFVDGTHMVDLYPHVPGRMRSVKGVYGGLFYFMERTAGVIRCMEGNMYSTFGELAEQLYCYFDVVGLCLECKAEVGCKGCRVKT
ncbi:hypothetical protein SDC9_75595 [bioreactor metagenome]|uniref:Uncharacterized protein n=1 Tax=bioreactor metagenome TaxID=1076179 RepID=A0A644YKN5_9ZZZZ